MQCPACQTDNREGRRFCSSCGAKLAIVCGACEFENEPEDAFCGGCGASLVGAPAAPQENSAQILEETTPTGERRQVTVLFADLSGYTRLSQDRDAEETHALLTQYFNVADGAVEKYGGHVDKHIGDGVMAVFGAPVAHTNDSERAVRTALDIHREVGEFDPPLKIHVGIASGEVVASGLGSGTHQEYTVTGESVNLASRLQDLAASGETLISKAVHDAVAAQVDAAQVDDVAVKGIEQPISVWLLKGLRRADTAPAASPFVGRRAELRQFEGVLETCRDSGRGQTVYVRGDAGIGKTRLLQEFQKTAEGAGFTCHGGLVLDFGVGKGEDAIGSIVRSLLSIPPDSNKAVRAAAADRAVEAGLIDDERLIHLNDLLDLPQPTELLAVFDAMDGAARAAGYRETLVELVERSSERAPLVIRIEDVHWADETLLDHLAALAQLAAACRMILVLTSRVVGDPMETPWRTGLHNAPLTTIDLVPLRDDEAREFAGSYGDGLDAFATSCIERAEGNPLFLDQLLRSAQGSDEEIPGSIQSVVLARMDRLDPRDKEALQAAAVIGQRFALSAIRHLLGNDAYDCDALIEHLLVQRMGPDYLFGHALLRDGAYASLLKSRRLELHVRAAAWFEAQDPILYAEHLDRAESPDAAAAYRAAADAQVTAYHHERALHLVERGLEIATAISDRFDLLCLRGDARLALNEKDASLEGYDQALAIAESEVQRCRACVGRAEAMRDSGRYDEIFAALDEAQEIAERHELVQPLSQIHYHRGAALFPLGRAEQFQHEAELAMKFAQQAGSVRDEARALSGLADGAYAQGRMLTAYQHFSRCVELAREHSFGRIEAANLHVVGHTRLYRNDIEGGVADAVAGAEIAERVSNTRGQMIARTIEAIILVDTLDLVRVRFATQESLELAKRVGARAWEAFGISYQALIVYYEGNRDAALAPAQAACEMASENAPGFMSPWAHGILMLITDDADQRQHAVEEAEKILAGDCIGHNHLWFRRYAIEASLNVGDWGEAERHAAALEEFTRPEPLPWAEFWVQWGRAISACGRDGGDGGNDTVVRELTELRTQAKAIKLRTALPLLERWLDRGETANTRS